MSKGGFQRESRFSCGHRGFGRYCHRCAQADACERVGRMVDATASELRKARVGTGVSFWLLREDDSPAAWDARDFASEALRLRALGVVP